MIIGLDAADWTLIDPLIQQGELSSFDRLKKQGAWGKLHSIQPYLSPMIWTSIATGKEASEHGIVDFLTTDPISGQRTPTTSNLRQVKALWNIATDYGISVGFVGWLATWPAEPINGFMVSDRMVIHTYDPRRTVNQGEDDSSSFRKTFPEQLYHELEPLLTAPDDIGYKELRRFMDIDKDYLQSRHVQPYSFGDRLGNFKITLASDLSYKDISLYLYKKHKPRLFGVYLAGIDNAGHLFMNYASPKMEGVSDADYARFKDVISEYYKVSDRFLGELLDLMDKRTVCIVLSDHGFKSGSARPSADARIHTGAAVDWHDKYGIISILGYGVKQGATLKGIDPYDITPTVLALLGLPIAGDMKGRFIEEAFKTSLLNSLKIQKIASYESGGIAQGSAPLRSKDDDVIMERLASLGYVETKPKKSPSSHNNLGGVYAQKGEYSKALAEFGKALQIDPDFIPAKVNMANVYLMMGKANEALAILDEVLPQVPPNKRTTGLMMAARAYAQLKEADKAKDYLEQALELSPNSAEVLNNAANLAAMVGDYNYAVTMYQRARELDPSLAFESYTNLAVLYASRGNTAKAIQYREKALAIEPNHLETLLDLASLYREQGDLKRAVSALQRAVKVDASSFDAWMKLGVIYGLQHRYQDSINALLEARRLDPQSADVEAFIGVAYHQLGEEDKARQHFSAALQLDAQNQIALSYFKGESEADKRKKPPGKIRLSQIIVSSMEQAESILAQLGQGKSFEQLAREHSIDTSARFGGDLGYVAPSELLAPLAEAASELKIKEHSGIIKSPIGYHILMRTD